MRWWVTVALAILLMLAVALPAAAEVPPALAYLGVWKSIDGDADGDGAIGPGERGDASVQMMTVMLGLRGRYTVAYTDFGASVCGRDDQGKALYAASVLATGSIVDSRLDANGPLWCMAPKPFKWGNIGMSLVYDAEHDTIWDGGTTWHRAR